MMVAGTDSIRYAKSMGIADADNGDVAATTVSKAYRSGTTNSVELATIVLAYDTRYSFHWWVF